MGINFSVGLCYTLLKGNNICAQKAIQDAERRPSKRQRDLADIARLVEAYPYLKPDIPAEILAQLV